MTLSCRAHGCPHADLTSVEAQDAQAIGPEHCALCLEVPLTRDEFYEDLAEDAPRDLAKSLARRFPSLSRKELWSRYLPFAQLALGVAQEAAGFGVNVVRRGGLAGLSDAARARSVITFVSHWVGTPFRQSEITDFAGLRARLERSKTHPSGCPVERCLLEWEGICAAASPQDVVCALNRQLRTADRAFAWTARSPGEPMPPAGPTRVHLEDCFGQFLARGRCVETANGMATAPEFIAAVPECFDGTIDLTVCHSLMIAEALKRARPKCTVIANRQHATAEVRIIIYRHVVRLLSRGRRPFAGALAEAHLAVLKHIQSQRSDSAHP